MPLSRTLLGQHFPATSPEDCPGDIRRPGAPPPPPGCAGDTDQYGRYRSAETVAVKHHWWWLQNFLWDVWPPTQGHRGFTLFLEEDHLVSGDILDVLEGLTGLMESGEAVASFLSLDDGKGQEEVRASDLSGQLAPIPIADCCV